jgi:DNA-binding MarR family transcriptional regulator
VEGPELVSLMARACERLVGSVFEALEQAGYEGLTSTQALALRTLAGGPLTARALADLLGVTAQGAGKVTGDLERRGLLSRSTDPRDARARPLVLTAEGRRAAAAMQAAEQRTVGAWQDAASAADLEATARALGAYLAATEPAQAAPARRMRFT